MRKRDICVVPNPLYFLLYFHSSWLKVPGCSCMLITQQRNWRTDQDQQRQTVPTLAEAYKHLTFTLQLSHCGRSVLHPGVTKVWRPILISHQNLACSRSWPCFLTWAETAGRAGGQMSPCLWKCGMLPGAAGVAYLIGWIRDLDVPCSRHHCRTQPCLPPDLPSATCEWFTKELQFTCETGI